MGLKSHSKDDAKALTAKQDSADFETYDTARNDGRIGTGGGATAMDTNMFRFSAVQFALDLHRGKDKPASVIVTEAAVFESYLLNGAAPVVPETPTQPAPLSTLPPA